MVLLALAAFMLYFSVTSYSSVGSAENTQSSLKYRPVKIGKFGVNAELAQTEAQRIKGLSDRKSLPKNQGMLFDFGYVDRHGIWMKDMNFAIDIVWIGQNYQIVGIAESVSPSTYPKVFKPEAPALYVLELNAGIVKENRVKIGDPVFFEL